VILNRPLVLHDGLTLPVGSRIGFASLAIQTDPVNFPDPHKFEGFRFARLREESSRQKGHDERHKKEEEKEEGDDDDDDSIRWGAATPATTNLV
jgi:hypothetical protein